MSLDDNHSGTVSAMQPLDPVFGGDRLREYVVTHIDEAIEKGWVRPYYQPVIRTLTGKLCGFEALARWEDPIFGTLSPAAFIPALEEAKLIHLLDCSIVRQVCIHYRESADRGELCVPISFNLSRLDFDLCDIFDIVEDIVHEFEVPRGMLNVEITETILGTDPVYMKAMVRKFHDVGYQVWMDDFGSGYSTLNVLKDFDFDELKIDMEFLNRFGEKSKTILASVVDMAKKLGIQTLAEGVETEEHRDYLRRIGCEKMQGYLFGKPLPYGAEASAKLFRAIGVETRAERLYFSKVGAVNTLSLSERDLTPGNTSQDYVTSMPLAIVEYNEGVFKMLDSNRVFREGLENVGVASIEEAEQRINDPHRQIARQTRRLIDNIEVEKFARIDYVVGDVACVLRAKHIASQNGRIAVLVSIDDTIEQGERKRHDRMLESLSVLYSIYEHVDIIHLDEGFTEPVFSVADYHLQYDASLFKNLAEAFANAEIYPADRERYIAFMDHDTMIDRIKKGGERFIVDFFRARERGGDYDWKLFGLIHLAERPGNQVMLCIRSTHWANDSLFRATFDQHGDEGLSDDRDAGAGLTDGSLWRALSNEDSMSLFWKDRDRRFVGANQAFLDYYGFDSVKEIVGKTDEDMGWHIDPIPFMRDELRVLNEGAHVKDVVGQCIVRGEVRDIVATKRPVYRDGHIVGLVGFFSDVEGKRQADDEFAALPIHDSVTGVLNYTGLEAATWRFVDTYKRQGIDFAMISINIESFQAINDELGYAFGEKVLKRVADELRDVAGQRCAIGHVFADRFVVLAQDESDESLQELSEAIEKRLMSIAEVDGTPCTIYALAGFARYSKLGDVEEMKRYNRDRRLARRDEGAGISDVKDVITSSLL